METVTIHVPEELVNLAQYAGTTPKKLLESFVRDLCQFCRGTMAVMNMRGLKSGLSVFFGRKSLWSL